MNRRGTPTVAGCSRPVGGGNDGVARCGGGGEVPPIPPEHDLPNGPGWTAFVLRFGGTLGGSLAYDYGFNVETAGDSPVWHVSEVDVFRGTGGDDEVTAQVRDSNRREGTGAP